jgi:hypothetical protein
MAIGNSTLQQRLLLALVIPPFPLPPPAMGPAARAQDQAPQAPTPDKIAPELRSKGDQT